MRLGGEDVERGTFSHRHKTLSCQIDEDKYTPLADSKYMKKTAKGRIEISNSNLAEMGPMAFEIGYALESPKNLVLWEA